VHFAQSAEDIDTISFTHFYPGLSHIALKWLTLVNPFLPKFCPKITHPPTPLIWASDTSYGKLRPSG